MTEIDWENPFKAEDFMLPDIRHQDSDMKITMRYAEQKANARFRELLKEAETVYGRKGCNGNWFTFETKTGGDTHSAKLIAIKRLK